MCRVQESFTAVKETVGALGGKFFMRIISQFRDFYDGLSSPDDPAVWLRQQKKITISPNDPLIKKNCPVGFEPWMDCTVIPCQRLAIVDFGLIFFYGKLFPYWKKDNAYSFSYDEYCLTYNRTVPDNKWNIWQTDAVRKLFALDFPSEYKQFNIRYKTPVLHLYRAREPEDDVVNRHSSSKKLILEFNPRLQELQFYKMLDAVSVFQELERYIFNDLAETPTPPENISDKDKAWAHGFRDKYSFRKEPGKK